MKKIAFIYLGRKGGAVPYGFEMAKSLLTKGVGIMCVLSELICNRDEWIELSSSDRNLQLLFLPTYNNKTGFIKDIFNRKPYTAAVTEIKKYNPDAIYLPMTSLNARKLLFRLKGIPIVTTIHDYTQHPGMKNPITALIFNRIERISDKFVVLTAKYAPMISEKHSVPLEKIRHIPHANFSYYNKENRVPSFNIKNRILFFGRISKYKGISILLKAMDLLKDSMPELHLSIVGKGELSNDDIRIINSNSDRISLNNEWISDDQVWEIFDQADMTIIPYIEASQSGVVAISLSCGRTVVASDVGGLREQIDPVGGSIVQPGDPQALAKEISKLYSDHANLLDLNKRSYKYANELLTWDHSANKLIELIYGNNPG